MTKKISEKIFRKIKEDHLKPRPRWEFLLKDYTVWTLFGISLIIGGLAVSVIFHMVVNNDWDLYQYVSGNFSGFLLATLPYFWLIILAFFIVSAYYNLKHTKKGYLLSLGKILVLSLLISVFLGGGLYAAGLSEPINNVFSRKIPFYKETLERRCKMWNRPQKGLLAGRVLEVESPQKFYLLDFNNKNWCVECPQLSQCPHIQEGFNNSVKIIGKTGKDCFQARDIKLFKTAPAFKSEHRSGSFKSFR